MDGLAVGFACTQRVAMLRAARKAARALRRLPDDASTLVHLHAASDWSLRRKLRWLQRARLRSSFTCIAGYGALVAGLGQAGWSNPFSIQRHVDAVVVLDGVERCA